MPSYVAIPATPSDIPQIATLMFAANVADPAFSAIYPKGNTPKSLMHFVAQLEDIMDEDPSAYMMIVKDASSGECVGYAIWHFMIRGGMYGSPEIGGEFFPVEANIDTGVELVGASGRKRMEVLKEVLAGREDEGYACKYPFAFCCVFTCYGTQHWHGARIDMDRIDISAIGVHPSHQRQGAASKMLDWGVDRADDKFLPIYVESTPAALKLYSNFKFSQYDKLELDLKPYKDGPVEHICMIRLPNTA